MSIADKLQTIAENERKVHEAGMEKGKKTEYDAFWDSYQYKGGRTNYTHAFRSWVDACYNPKYPIAVKGSSLSSVYYGCPLSDTKISITHLGGTDSGGGPKQVFYGATLLKTIPSLTVAETTTFTQWFNNCTALENLTLNGTIGQNGFNVSWSELLSHDSLMSIINALADKSEDTSGTVWTVTLGEANINKLSDEEKNIAVQKGWVLG